MHLLLLIGVCPSVCLWEASELRSPQHLTIPSDFFPMFCPELLRRFWSDQSETYTDWIYMGWSCTPPLGGDVGPSVCLWEVSELRSPQHFTNPSVFSNVLSWTCPGVLVGSIWNLYILNIYGLELCTSPWGRRRTVRFSVRVVGT